MKYIEIESVYSKTLRKKNRFIFPIKYKDSQFLSLFNSLLLILETFTGKSVTLIKVTTKYITLIIKTGL